MLLDRDRLETASSGAEYGQATAIFDARNGHDPVRFGFKYMFLVDFFEVLNQGGRARVALKDDQSAVEFRPVEEPNGIQYHYVVTLPRV